MSPAALPAGVTAAIALSLAIPRRQAAELLLRAGGAEAALAEVRVASGQRGDLLATAARVREALVALGGRVEVLTDPTFPPPLRDIPDPPLLLYCLGPLPLCSAPAVAVIGARRATGYGLSQAERLGRELAAAGVTVVSGMALGIDGAAHRGALAAGGRTLAVLGTGIDRPYPATSRPLYREIARRGLVVSEFSLGAGPRKEHFPLRNRLISGLSKAVVVVEARVQSGTKHTVDFALAQGRDVCAVPGPVASLLSEGPHRLIRQGAALVRNAQDVLEAANLELLPSTGGGAALPLPADPCANSILNQLRIGPQPAEALALIMGLPPGRLAGALALLEMGGFVIRQVDGTYATNPVFW